MFQNTIKANNTSFKEVWGRKIKSLWFKLRDTGTTCSSSKQPKLLLSTVWPTVRFQQLDSIRGFLKGGRPHPHCMSHYLKKAHTYMQLDQKLHCSFQKQESRSHADMEALFDVWPFSVQCKRTLTAARCSKRCVIPVKLNQVRPSVSNFPFRQQ